MSTSFHALVLFVMAVRMTSRPVTTRPTTGSMVVSVGSPRVHIWLSIQNQNQNQNQYALFRDIQLQYIDVLLCYSI